MLKAAPALVYKAFLDADALCRWLPPNGYVCKVSHLDAKVGGTFTMAFTQFHSGKSHCFSGEYLELVPARRLRYTDVFDDPDLPGTIEVTIELKSLSSGTELHITQAGIPEVVPAEMCYLGWQESLLHLALLVENGPPAEA